MRRTRQGSDERGANQRTPPGRIRRGATRWSGVRESRLAISLLVALMTAGACESDAPPQEASQVLDVATPTPWRHLTMDDLDVDLDRFRPIRARYLQVMYDLSGQEEVQLSSVVLLEVDRAVHSGGWDGQLPAVIEPLQEPGLVVTWRIQNALWNGFDRVRTDGRLSMSERIMPGTAGPLIGSVDGSELTRIEVDSRGSEEPMPADRVTLPEGSINVLTAPYVLASMDLEPGDRFTLPGYAMIGGPGGGGIPWRGAYEVRSVSTRLVNGVETLVADVLFNRMDTVNGLTVDAIDRTAPRHRTTRLLISPDPPYLLGRANLLMGDDGRYRYFREFLGLVDWASQPLPLSDYADPRMWDLDLDVGRMVLDSTSTPSVVLPLRDP